jgi:nitroimidazol reductase NimA-like FMN-containing flavoprotein (pyridoxamine 5'-phosphate oxidase superfamily)
MEDHMDRTAPVQRTWLEEIRTSECIDRLESSWLGRLGVIVDGHPEIFPVNHVYDRPTSTIVFPSNSRTKLASALGEGLVAFEVDGVETDELVGWSVLVVGSTVEETQPQAIAQAMALRRATWAVSPTTRWVRIHPSKITGRRIQLVAG